MNKIDKTDIENIKILEKELNSKKLAKIKIKKKDYEIEISKNSQSIFTEKNINKTLDENKKDVIGHEKENNEIKKENIVSSPMVGVVYLSSDPDSSPFIKEGQHVKQGDILLLIEAMKTFNEIKAPKSGVVKKILALNSQPVEFGENLVIFE